MAQKTDISLGIDAKAKDDRIFKAIFKFFLQRFQKLTDDTEEIFIVYYFFLATICCYILSTVVTIISFLVV